MKTIRFASLFAITFILAFVYTAAIAANAPQSMAPPNFSTVMDKAVVYIYRDRMLKATAMAFLGYFNDEKIGQLENGEYARYLATPSEYDFWITNAPERSKGGRFFAAVKEVNLKPGRIYFYKIIPKFGFYWSLEIHPVNEATAKQEISSLYKETK